MYLTVIYPVLSRQSAPMLTSRGQAEEPEALQEVPGCINATSTYQVLPQRRNAQMSE